MDDIGMHGAPADAHGAIEALLQENRSLKGVVLALSKRLLAEQRQVAAAADALDALRSANAQLLQSLSLAEDGRAAAEQARSEAQAALARQTVFLSMLAHELRNPMASIEVASSMIGSLGIVNSRLDKLVGIVKRQSAHLVRLVDDLLDASRIATGKISLQMRVLDLREVLGCALESAHATLAAREQDAVLEVPPAPLMLRGDPVRLAQLFCNLLVNASKFSPPREPIALSAALQGDMVSVAVRDHGKGIAADDQGCIFDLFAQGSEERAHACSGGLGIGLPLVRSIAALHGGSVRVESAGAGCGSEFIVQLPLAPPRAGRAGQAPA